MQPEQNQLGVELPPIPDELIMEIFFWLPVKSLMRFKLVCKSLNSFISDNHFVKQHLCRCSARNDNRQALFVSTRPGGCSTNFASLPVKSLLKTTPSIIMDELQYLHCKLDNCMVIGSCNGLVCLIGNKTDDPNSYEEQYCVTRVSFWNPAMKSFSHKLLNVPVRDQNWDAYYGAYIFYVDYGFGYDYVNDTFKVVMLVCDTNQVNVFSMGDTNWRDIGSYFSHLTTGSIHSNGVHLNGTLNWVVYDKIDVTDNASVLSFDLNKEEFVKFLLPDIPKKSCCRVLGVLGECLCFSYTYDKRQQFSLWQMKKFGVDGSWTKLLNINYNDVIDFNFHSPSRFPLYMFDNGDILMLHLKLLYNRRDNRFHLLEIPNDMYKRVWVMIYSESLISSY